MTTEIYTKSTDKNKAIKNYFSRSTAFSLFIGIIAVIAGLFGSFYLVAIAFVDPSPRSVGLFVLSVCIMIWGIFSCINAVICDVATLIISVPILLIFGLRLMFLLCLVIPIVDLLILKSRKKVTDNEYDEIVKNSLTETMFRATEKLNLNMNQFSVTSVIPVVLDGYDFNYSPKTKIGKDGKVRSSIYKHTILFLLPDKVYYYIGAWNTITNIVNETTGEWSYTEIDSVKTEKKILTLQGKNNEYAGYVIKVTDGFTVGGGLINIEEGEQSVRQLNAILSQFRAR